MNRRKLICASATSLLGVPFFAWTQSTPRIIGFLSGHAEKSFPSRLAAFRKGLAEAGFVEGKDVVIEYRWAGGEYDRLAALAAELVNKPVAVLATAGGAAAALAGKAATSTIPVVVLTGADFVQLGLVVSLNRPGGNVTGISQFTSELGPKRLEVLRELKPGIASVALLVNPASPNAESEIALLRSACDALRCKLIVLKAASTGAIDAAFDQLTRQRTGAMIVATDAFLDGQHARIVARVARLAIPCVYGAREYVVAGGLVSYGVSFDDTYRQSGAYVGRILKGGKPADLPVMLPTQYDMVLNLKTARALKLKVPQSTMLRATETIE